MPGVRSPSSPGVGVGIGGSPVVEEPGANPNLLLWTEAFDNAVWTATSAAIVADAVADPFAVLTAETVTNSAGGALRQISGTASTTGAAATALVDTGGEWIRRSVSGTFDSLSYTFSVYLRDGTGGGIPSLRLRLDRSGGFLRCSIEDAGDEAIYHAWGAQLEQAASASTYQKREGS